MKKILMILSIACISPNYAHAGFQKIHLHGGIGGDGLNVSYHQVHAQKANDYMTSAMNSPSPLAVWKGKTFEDHGISGIDGNLYLLTQIKQFTLGSVIAERSCNDPELVDTMKIINSLSSDSAIVQVDCVETVVGQSCHENEFYQNICDFVSRGQLTITVITP